MIKNDHESMPPGVILQDANDVDGLAVILNTLMQDKSYLNEMGKASRR